MRLVSVLGCTGSIGGQALDIIRRNPEEFRLFSVSARQDSDAFAQIVHEFKPSLAASEIPVSHARRAHGVEYLSGLEASSECAAAGENDVVINGISGIAALKPLLSALHKGKRVALANKESIVCGSGLVRSCLSSGKGEIVPVDSEQSAIFQCLSAGRKADVAKLILTASGGPFWQMRLSELENATPHMALCHPTWRMGKKITIDSATLFNKGLEIIEASGLFDVPGEKITVLIHPQSIVHSAVAYIDGNVVLNAANPDMRLAIQYALTYPERIPSPVPALRPEDITGLCFYPADLGRFKPLALAYEVLKAGGTAATVYNGANERAVELFLDGKLGFNGITRAVEYALSGATNDNAEDLDAIFEADRLARGLADEYAAKHLL